MAAYTGSGSFPYWMTITNSGGVSNATALSENIPVQPGLNYQFQIVASFAGTWASGAEAQLIFYDANGNVLQTNTSTPSSMTGGVLYQINTGTVTAPANSSFAIASIILVGNATSALSVYQAEIDDQNYVQVNINYTFSYTFWPWSPANSSVTLAWAFNPLLTGDSDSLVLDGIIEVMGGIQGTPCDVPELLDSNGQGPVFRILAPPSLNSSGLGYQESYDLNAPQPTQDVVASMLLDGERPFGARASNRTISLPVVIFGTQAGGTAQVLKAQEYLMSVIDQQTWQIKWTPADTGLAMLFDCFRALPSHPVYGFNYSAGGTATGSTIGRPNYPIGMITLSIQALPYGRSDIDGVQALQFASPLSNGVPTVSPSTIDTFNTVFNPPPIISTPVFTTIGTNSPTSVSTWNIAVAAGGVAVGNTAIVEVAGAANNVTGVTDTQGNTYTRISALQAGASAQWQFVYLSNIVNPLSPADHLTVTASGSGNWSSVALKVNGAYSLRNIPVSTTGTSSSFTTNVSGLNQYDLLLSCSFGLGSLGATPTGFHSLGGFIGNGFDTQMSWIAQPLNQTTVTFTIASGLPGTGWGVMLFALQPVNQYWNQDLTTPPPGFVGHSVHYTPPRPFKVPYPAATYQQTLQSTANIVGCPVISMWFGQSYDTQWPKDPKFVSNITLHWTLTDGVGRTLSFSSAYKHVKYGTHPSAPKWTQLSAPVPQGKVFNYNAVSSYTVRITNWSQSGHTGYVRMHCWLNDIAANPQTIQNNTSPRGSVYQMYSLPGSARSSVSVQCQLPAAQNITKEITTPSTGSWIVPPGVYSVNAEAWGGGGAGAASNLSRTLAGGGGGGGEWAQEPALSVLPGQRVPWSLGSAGVPGQLVNTVIQYTKDGLGHWTCPANVTQVTAEMWGGGAAGAAGGGGGGGGEYARCRVPVTPGTTYTLWTGKGGMADKGTSASQVAARQGSASWFGGSNNLSANTALTQAHGGSTSITGGTSGGNGGTGGTVAPGTQWAAISTKTNTATTSVIFSPNTGAKALPQGTTGLMVISLPATATITVKDSTGKNSWVQLGSPAVNTGVALYAFWCPTIQAALNANSTFTVTQSVSQAATIGVFNTPWVCSQDSANTAGSGASTTPSATSSVPANTSDLVFAIFSNSGANTTSTPAGWQHGTALGTAGAGGFADVFGILNTGSGQETAASTYAGSQNWASLTLTFGTELHYAGGRGGTSPGPSGGGGGGAAGATGAGGVGGDSQPFVSNVGRWQQGGAGGTGAGQGGNGGAGAGTPGFPGLGVAPGGGGGGGYQTQPLFNASNPSNVLPGQQQTNFLGADGALGMVQLTYAVGSGSPVNGGNTSFGSAATTGTIVTAHGGLSAANNSAVGALGGSGSSNASHNNGGAGGLLTSTTMGSYLAAPAATTLLTFLNSASWNATANTTGVSAATVSQGVAIALIESTTQVSDLQVTDSAGNQYQLQGVIRAGNGSLANVALSAYVANIEFPITTSTTLTVSSATSQQYGVLWYASPWLVAGVTSGNSGTGQGTGTAFSGQFGNSDTSSIQLELGVVIADTSRTVSGLTQTKTWFNASSTNSLTAGTMNMAAYVMQNEGGGTGAVNSGDTFSGTLSGSGNWGVLCVPLTMINQQNALIKMDWRSGTTPGTSTNWATEAAISANGFILVVGQSGTGVTAAPTSVSDGGGNAYTLRVQQAVSGLGNYTMWAFTAPVTAALASGASGQMHWGAASAAPNYWSATYWLPNASAFDPEFSWASTGNSTAPTASLPVTSNNTFEVALLTTVNGTVTANPAVPWNYLDTNAQSYLNGRSYAAQNTDLATLAVTGAGLTASAPWGLGVMSFQQNLAGTGGGAAGGPNNAGYPGVWQYGGPAFAGGGKGGQGAAPPPQAGNGASYPGGGGGGCLAASGTAQEGGQGAPGAVRLTWTPPLQAFNTLIVHSLGQDSDPQVNPLVPIPITDVPNNTEYTVPSVNGLLPATFSSTYTVLLANFLWNNATSSAPRQITVTINQYEYPGGPRYSYQVSRSIVPATDSTNGLIDMGEVTLPIKDYLAYNDQSYFTVSINDTDTSDRFMDVLFLDTLGQTAIINIDPGQPGYGQYVNYFIDEPTSDRDLGFVGASFQDRQHQVSVMDYAQLSGGPLYIGPGDNLFLVYSTSGAPSLSVNYAPRWYLHRVV